MTVSPEGPELTPVPEPSVAPAVSAEPLAETAAEIEELDVDAPRVAILMESESDMPVMEAAEAELAERDILSEIRVMAVDGERDAIGEYAENAHLRGIKVIIAGAGAGSSAALPGAVVAHTDLPVIAVPLSGGRAADAGAAEAPVDLPVAWVRADHARNAAVVAARILSL